ncbi:MAG TPA: HlyD family efflux transporter periplasmic adaptor subunit [Roseimicrobium sp.]|nr:HlyD family efflux transporter periplasmic adaptor subunit [Roseimicrobium sp.]
MNAPESKPTPTAPATSAPRKNRNRKHSFLPWIGVALLIALIIIGFMPKATLVETAKVAKGKLRATVNEEGKTRIRQRYLVSAPIAGQTRRINFKPGAEVVGGKTVLAVIDPLASTVLDVRNRALAEARRDMASANLERALEAERFAASELARYKKLSVEKVVSVQELDAAQTRAATALKDRASSEAALREAKAQLMTVAPGQGNSDGTIEVTSPVSGRVLRVIEESSRTVAAGAPLIEIGDPADIEVIVEALSRDGASIAEGTQVELEQWGGATPLQARVRLVEPAAFTKVSALGVEEQRVYVVADIATPYDQRKGLGDNFRVEARIVVWEAENILKVPAGALFRQGQKWSTYVLANGAAELRTVEVGRTSGSETQILGGLKEGDEVILYPGERIKAGLKVQPIVISP